MRIKRIDLCGFKSFCDKTSVDLSQNITAVVGPNGCGKSNIVDALLWAMGEQRAKHLRGKSMEDVIFNGSDSRGPAGLSEVSITFENDGRVPVEYLDYAEITVTRRLHRDGSSEYLINKVPVRLRDVTNLFLGTGVGTKAYSIIEQGRVGLIVSAKPEDRRHLIEEAAGITKYRSRKQAAERKMDATRQNLLRVSDVLEEIGKRLGNLRRQAQKAERYKRYKEEMRAIELRAAAHRMLGGIAEEKVIGAARRQLEAQHEAAEVDLATREQDVIAARAVAAEEERRLTVVQEQLYQLENRLKLLENQSDYQTKEAAELESRSSESRAEVVELSAKVADESARREALEQERGAIHERRAELRAGLDQRERAYSAIRSHLVEVERAVERERADLAQVERRAAGAEAESRAAQHRSVDISERMEARREEGARVIARLEALDAAALDIDSELGRLRAELERLKSRKEDATARLAELRSLAEVGRRGIEQLRSELQRKRSRLSSLEEIQARYEGFGQGTRAIMQREDAAGVQGLFAEMIDAPARYEVALEAALGQRLGTVLVESAEAGADAIEYLKRKNKGRGSFIAQHRCPSWLNTADTGVVWERGGWNAGQASARTLVGHRGVHGALLDIVSYAEEHSSVARSLLGQIVVVEDLRTALDLWDHVENQTLVTLEGEVLAPDGTVTGGTQDGELAGVLARKREIKEISEVIAEVDGKLETASSKQVALKTEIAALEELLAEVTQGGHDSDKEILTREKDLGRIHSENESLRQRRAQMNSEIRAMEGQLDEIRRRQEQLEEQRQIAVEARHLAADIIALLLAERERLAALAEEAAAAATDAKVEMAQVETSFRAVDEKLRQISAVEKEHRARIERLGRSSAEADQRVLVLREKVEAARLEMAGLVDKRAGVREELAQGRAAQEKKANAATLREAELKGRRDELAAVTKELGRLEVKRSELELGQRHLREQVWERYRERLESLLHDFHLDPLVTDVELERLEQLRQLIHRMGEINLTAIEEYDELSGRHEFLVAQKADLEGALGQLQRAIQKINRTSRQRFLDTFNAVNEQFQQVFPRLFRGGRAKLILGEHEDVLQAGVDIVAQPPGKKLASMDIMSGGEKALTATSLIFAMFLVKPTPFCLLDEVDAPLDEANVVRFREMVREMSDTSQFIIITHNRNTMEISDKLFGVTMEEPGISKIVTINLADAEKAAA